MTKNEIKRKELWAVQCGKCAICLEYQETVTGMCFMQKQDKMICRKCSTSLSNYRSALARGVTPEMLAAFEVEPTEDSQTEDTPPERLMVDGVWCEVIGGAWVPMDPQPE